jgi:PPOX class probable F420-dependent enzyme
MPSLPPGTAEKRFAAAPVGRLATVTALGRPHIVPVCFALHDGTVYTAVDAKPKATSALARLEHIRATGRASLLVDHYEEDWANLWWVRVDGVAEVVQSDRAIDALAAKYAQYRAARPDGPVIEITPESWRSWAASTSA